jgi:hypothetical protein
MDPTLPGVGTNRYAYSSNDPVNKSDPNGHVFGFAIAFAIAVAGALFGGTEPANAPGPNDKAISQTPGQTAVGMATGATVGLKSLGAAKTVLNTVTKKKDKDEEAKAVSTAEQAAVTIDPTRKSVDKKVNDYLLNPDHPVGKTKANWFEKALGFTQKNGKELADQLNFDKAKAIQTGVTDYGTKYNQVIDIVGTNGKTISVVTGWIEKDGIVSFVTAIPTKL